MDYFRYFVTEHRFQLRCPREITAKYLEPVCEYEDGCQFISSKYPYMFTQGLPTGCREPHTYSYIFLNLFILYSDSQLLPSPMFLIFKEILRFKQSLFKHTVCNNFFYVSPISSVTFLLC